MRSAIKPEIDRTITGAEVMKWFMRGHKPWPAEQLCVGIAARLNKMRWPVDPPLPALAEDEWYEIDYSHDGSFTIRVAPCPSDPWWDSEKAAARAKALVDDIPAMLWHWHRMQGTRFETLPGQKPKHLRGGYDAIERLRVALDAALPYIEFPFGEYERQDHRKRKRPSPWHAHAVAVTHVIADALRQSGHPVRGTSHNSAVVRIVCKALVRIGYDRNITSDAVAKHLTGWYAEFGRSF